MITLFNLLFFIGMIKQDSFPPKLTKEEEEYYINLLQSDRRKEARDKLITHNLRLVGHIASKYDSKDENYDDLISLGTIGLVKAIDTFSKEKCMHIATYASRCIENEILMALRSNKKHSKNVSLNEKVGIDKDGTSVSLIDVLPSSEENPFEQMESKATIQKLKKYFEILDEREKEILTLRYGLNNKKEYTQKEISSMYSISRSYVSRIEKRALTKLLSEFKKNH